MSLLKQINDKGAVLEWCPVKSKPNLVALGTKVLKMINHKRKPQQSYRICLIFNEDGNDQSIVFILILLLLHSNCTLLLMLF